MIDKKIIKLCDSKLSSFSGTCNTNDFSDMKAPFTREKILYHYCSLDTFYKIVNNNSFWLSSPRFMNDLSEYKYSIDIILKSIDEYIKSYKLSDNENKLLDAIRSMIALHKSESCSFTENQYIKLDYFMCFSSMRDYLPLWSMYRGDNTGISIGFDFKDFNPLPKGFFLDMIYNENDSNFSYRNFINNVLNFYEKELLPIIDNSSVNQITGYLAWGAASYIVNNSINQKDSSFSHEKETRFILRSYDKGDLKFRATNKFIVPYIDYKYPEEHLPITSITVSPYAEEKDLVLDSIKGYLDYKGYDVSPSGIDFKQSKVPFKPR